VWHDADVADDDDDDDGALLRLAYL